MTRPSTEDTTVESRGSGELAQLRGVIDRASGLLEAFRQDLVPHLEREADHLDGDLAILDEWAHDAETEGVDALAGGEMVVTTARKRVAFFEEKIGEADAGLGQRLEQLGDAIEDLEGRIEALNVSQDVFVTYVNRSFAARYGDPSVRVGTILEDAGRDDVDELGLYPLDDLFGDALPDLAFPANQDVDLREENRVYWESESDGGSIA